MPHVESITEETEPSEEQKKLLAQNIRLFTNSNAGRYVDCSVHCNRGMAIDEVIKESRFAECMIVDAALSVDQFFESLFQVKTKHQTENYVTDKMN